MDNEIRVLTGYVGHLLELLLPVFGDLDGLHLPSLSLRGHALLVGVVQHLLEEVGMDGVEYIEEVLPGRILAFWEDVGEVLLHLLIIGELRPEVYDSELVIVRDFDEVDLLLLEQLLLLRKQRLEEVFIDRLGRRQIELYYMGMRDRCRWYSQCLSR